MRPLLLTKETEREHGANSPKKLFHYDYHTDMNMLNGRPFIEAGSLRNRSSFRRLRRNVNEMMRSLVIV